MKQEKYKCPLCHILHNNKNSFPFNQYHNSNSNDKICLCSSCINKLLTEESNQIFPESSINYNNISAKNNMIKNEIKHELNKSIIEEIRQDSKNKTLIQDIKQHKNNKILILKDQNMIKNNTQKNTLNNSQSTSNIYSIKQYYIERKKHINKSQEYQISALLSPICHTHSSPLNEIRVNNKRNSVSNYTFYKNEIKENDLIQYINELNNIYNIIEKNKNDYTNFNQKFLDLIKKINDDLIQKENELNELKDDIINKINNHFTNVSNIINMRKKEINDKFKSCTDDISNLIKSSLNWIQEVQEINKNSNNTKNKEISNLINKGKQLNENYNYIKDIKIKFEYLDKYEQNGINIIKNNEILKLLNNKEKIIEIKENQDLIKLLNLSLLQDLNKESINNKIYCKKKIINVIRHNHTASNFYKNKSKNERNFKFIQQQNFNFNNTNSEFNTKISVSKLNNEMNSIELNEVSFPFLNNIGNKNKNIKKNILRYDDYTDYQKKHESIQINNESDNNININFNGHIFNYNSDSNFSIIIPETKNNTIKKKEIKENDTNKKRRTPYKIESKKIIAEKQNLKRCFSFNENNENKSIKKKIMSPTVNKNIKLIKNINNKILLSTINDKKYNTKTLKMNKKNKIKYKTLNNKELEKYVNYQLKKTKPNFNRINLKDYGIKLIASYFNRNKNKRYNEIKLQGCNLNNNDLNILIKSLIENQITIPSINLSENELNDNSMEFIIYLLNENEEVININIINNHFSKQAKEKFKEIIKIKKELFLEFSIQL